MSMNERKLAIRAVSDQLCAKQHCDESTADVRNIFGINVLDDATLAGLMPGDSYARLKETIAAGTVLSPEIAQDVAEAMKNWAVQNGATHYSHWFQPLTGSTAEKHDSFIEPDGNGGVILKFSGRNLIVGEPDASSFPSGGLRSTFEARGYTAWDPSSPAFIKKHDNGATLCIPTAFCSYNGAALDKKTPLLRSIQALKKHLRRIAKCFGIPESEAIEITLGAEQEYFLIDRNIYICRPDLIQTGRTLFGAPPPKHQQLDDHYFASIKPRVLDFMSEVDQELWRHGIPAKTRHNEAAPAQFEIAPVFEEQNLAVDHNMLTMEILRSVAERHNFVCLLHEKPFAGINGSGKHNNWAVSIGGKNLLSPGSDPGNNMLFLTTLVAVISAVDRHGDLLRSAACGWSNDLRLGAQEAPPAIISIFLGDELTSVIESLENGSSTARRSSKELTLGAGAVPALPRDATDRNRTSPFAYTGNKFEFRTPGASSSCAGPNYIINTIVAEAFDEMATVLEAAPQEEFENTLASLLAGMVRRHKRIIFNGDNYSEAWYAEAARRGLPSASTTPQALACLKDPANIALFEKYGVLTAGELDARFEVFSEEYRKKVLIEGELSASLARTVIFPAVIEHLARESSAVSAMSNVFPEDHPAVAEAKSSCTRAGDIYSEAAAACRKLESELTSGAPDKIIAAMFALRKSVDALERLITDDLWPLPKYREMLFIY